MSRAVGHWLGCKIYRGPDALDTVDGASYIGVRMPFRGVLGGRGVEKVDCIALLLENL